jgi:flagellar capping protein FliD
MTTTTWQRSTKLQSDAATSFVDAWNDLMARIDERSAARRA